MPRSAIDEIQAMRGCLDAIVVDANSIGAAETGQVWGAAGPLDRETVSARVDAVLADIAASCRIEPVTAPDNPGELATTLTRTFGAQVLDAVYLAAGERTLVTEDLAYRQVAEAAGATSVAWLQIVLAFARDLGLMTRPAYAKALVGLAACRHASVAVDARTLLDVFRDDGDDLEAMSLLSRSIGTEDAEVRSHVSVVAGFLGMVWHGGIPDLRVMRITGALLDALLRRRREMRPLVLAALRESAPRRLREYLDAWAMGHFVPMADIEEESAGIAAARRGVLVRSRSG